MPGGRGTAKRTVRVSEELWLAAQAKAEARGEVLAEEIRKFLERYIKRKDKS
jgi:hypothetical protein